MLKKRTLSIVLAIFTLLLPIGVAAKPFTLFLGEITSDSHNFPVEYVGRFGTVKADGAKTITISYPEDRYFVNTGWTKCKRSCCSPKVRTFYYYLNGPQVHTHGDGNYITGGGCNARNQIHATPFLADKLVYAGTECPWLTDLVINTVITPSEIPSEVEEEDVEKPLGSVSGLLGYPPSPGTHVAVWGNRPDVMVWVGSDYTVRTTTN